MKTFPRKLLDAVEEKVQQVAVHLSKQQSSPTQDQVLAEAKRMCKNIGNVNQEEVKFRDVVVQEAYATTETRTEQENYVDLEEAKEKYKTTEIRQETRYETV